VLVTQGRESQDQDHYQKPSSMAQVSKESNEASKKQNASRQFWEIGLWAK